MTAGYTILMKRTSDSPAFADYEYRVKGEERGVGLIRLEKSTGNTCIIRRIANDLEDDVLTHMAAGKLRTLWRNGDLPVEPCCVF